MCEISHQLKLCTCSEVPEDRSFWELFIYHQDQDLCVVGQPLFPYHITPQDLQDRDCLLQLLNEKNVFDFDYVPKTKDRLLIAIKKQNEEEESPFVFHGYSYRNKKWHHEDYDTFEWMHKHDVEHQGNIENLYKA